jgi:mRNA interferase MazF
VETLTAGTVVTIPFPFSNLERAKLRPALVLAGVEYNDWIFCQITSNSYFDSRAIEITEKDFSRGSLQRVSYVRPGKIFTGNIQLIANIIGQLESSAFNKVLQNVIGLFQAGIVK